MIKRFALAFIALLIIFGGLFGYKAYKGYENGQAMMHMKFPPSFVSVAVAKEGDWQPYIHAIGSAVSPNSVNVTTQVAGQVSGIYFKSGEFVKRGQPLVSLDDSVQLAQLNQYKAQLIINKFNYKQYKKAYLKNAVSKASYIQMMSALKQNEALIKQTETVISDMRITAPFSGMLGIRNASSVNLGQYINPGTSIISLYSVNPIYADFTLPQNDIGKIKIGQTIEINTDSYPNKPFTGKIKTISIDVNNVSRNITVRASIKNNDLLLRPGMFVTGKIYLPLLRNVVTVPSTAVTYNPYGDFVYTVAKTDGQYIAKTRYISAGAQRNGRVIILKGIKQGETVVTAGQAKLRNGSPVIIKTSKPGKSGNSGKSRKSKTLGKQENPNKKTARESGK